VKISGIRVICQVELFVILWKFKQFVEIKQNPVLNFI